MVEEKAKKQPLHWPAWVWIVGHFVLPAGFLINLLDRLSTPYGLNPLFHPYLSNLERVYLIVAYFAYLPISIVAAITMIVNRRVGWVCAFVALFISTVYFAIRALPEQYQYGSPGDALTSNIFTAATSILAIGVNITWLVYFILARRRYLRGSEKVVE